MRLQSMELPSEYTSHILSPLVEEWGEDGDSPEQTAAAAPPSSSSSSGRVRPMLVRPPPPLPTAPASASEKPGWVGGGRGEGGGYSHSYGATGAKKDQQQHRDEGTNSDNFYSSPSMGGPFFPSGGKVGRGGLATLGEECLSIRLDTLEVHIRARLQGLEEQLNTHSDCLKSFSQDFDSLQNLLGAVAKDAGLKDFREADENDRIASPKEEDLLSQDTIREVLSKFAEHSEHLERQVENFLSTRADELDAVKQKLEETAKRCSSELPDINERLRHCSNRLDIVTEKVTAMESSMAAIGTTLQNQSQNEPARYSNRGESERSDQTVRPDQLLGSYTNLSGGRKSPTPHTHQPQRTIRHPSPANQPLAQRQPPTQGCQQHQQQQQQYQQQQTKQQQQQHQQQQPPQQQLQPQQQATLMASALRAPAAQQVVVPSPPSQHRTVVVESTPSRPRSNERTKSPFQPQRPTAPTVGQTYLSTPAAKVALSAVPVQDAWTWTPEVRSRSPLSVSTPILPARATNTAAASSACMAPGGPTSNPPLSTATASGTSVSTGVATALPVPMAPASVSPSTSASIPTAPAMSAVPRSAYGPPIGDPLTGSARTYQARQPPFSGGSVVMRSYSGPSLFKLPNGASSSVTMRPAPPTQTSSGTPLASPYLQSRTLSREQTTNSMGSTSPIQVPRQGGDVVYRMK